MSGTPYDPYQPPKPIEPKPPLNPSGDARIRYMYVYSYVFENPNWMMNILYGFLCHLSSAIIPVVGPLLYMGYQFDVIESLHRYPGKTYPDFDLNKFGYYLQRSLWPFLVALIVFMPLFLVVIVLAVGGVFAMAGIASTVDSDVAPFVFLGGMSVIVMLAMGLLMLLSFPLQPMILRAGLSQDFGEGFKFGWALDFLKKVWLEMLLFQLFMMITSFPIALLGEACCLIGLYASIAFITLAQANMLAQLYGLYLARGGEPIPLKEPQIAAGS